MNEIRKIYVVFGLLVIKAILEFSYSKIISPSFGIFLYEPDFTKILESYIIYLFIAVLIIIKLMRMDKASDFVLIIIFFFLIIPILSMYGYYSFPRYMVYIIVFGFILTFILDKLTPEIRLPVIKNNKLIITLIGLITVLTYSDLILNGGLSRFSLGVFDVYDTRDVFLVNRTFITERFLSIQANVINMFLLAFALYKRKFTYIILMLGLQILIYGMTGFKTFLFAPALVLFAYFISLKNIRSKAFMHFTNGLNIVLILSVIHYYVTHNFDLVTLTIRRQFFLPVLNHYFYYDFFSVNEYNYYAGTFINPFMETKYNGITNIISYIYYGVSGGPNVGFYGDAFMQFGFLGVILFSVLLMYLLKILNALTKSIPLPVVISTVAMPTFSLVNSAFITVMVTHGLLFSLILLWLSSNYFIESRKTG